MTTTNTADGDLMHLLCIFVNRGDVGFLQDLGLSYDDIKTIKDIGDHRGFSHRQRARFIKHIDIDRNALPS